MRNTAIFTMQGTCSGTASTTTVLATQGGLRRYGDIIVDATLQGAAGGTLDVTLQRKVGAIDIGPDEWRDWIHFPTITAGNAAIRFTVAPCRLGTGPTVATVTVGGSNTASPAAAVLAANVAVVGPPGDAVRLIATTGTGVTGGTQQTVYLSCIEHGKS